jgi:hypothetical protein
MTTVILRYGAWFWGVMDTLATVALLIRAAVWLQGRRRNR